MTLPIPTTTAKGRSLLMANPVGEYDRRSTRPRYPVQTPAAAQVRRKANFYRENGQHRTVIGLNDLSATSSLKTFDLPKLPVQFPNKIFSKIPPEICLACTQRKLNCSGGDPNGGDCQSCTKRGYKCEWEQHAKLKEAFGKSVIKKGSRELKEILATQVCQLKQVARALAVSDDRKEAELVSTELLDNGFDRLSHNEMIRRLTSKPSEVPGSFNDDQSSSGGAARAIIPAVEKRLVQAHDTRSPSSTLSRPDSTEDTYGFSDNTKTIQKQSKNGLDSIANNALSWSQAVSKYRGHFSDVVVTPLDSSASSESVADGTTSTSASTSESLSSSESRETCDTSERTSSSTEDFQRELFSEPTVAEALREMVNRLMRKFCSGYHISATVNCRPANNGSSGCDSKATSDASSILIGTPFSERSHDSSNPRKRRSDQDGDENEDEENREQDTNAESTPDDHEKLKFGCPYYMRSPFAEYKYNSCSGHGFSTIHRMKEHLDRRHALPLHCARCWRNFKTEDGRDEHQREDEPCAKVPRPQSFLQCFTEAQGKDMGKRKGKRGRNEVEKWKDIYRILFPDDCESDIPEPYRKRARDSVSHSEDAHRQELRREVTQRMRKRVTTLIQDRYGQIESDIETELTRIAEEEEAEVALKQFPYSSTAPTHSELSQQVMIVKTSVQATPQEQSSTCSSPTPEHVVVTSSRRVGENPTSPYIVPTTLRIPQEHFPRQISQASLNPQIPETIPQISPADIVTHTTANSNNELHCPHQHSLATTQRRATITGLRQIPLGRPADVTHGQEGQIRRNSEVKSASSSHYEQIQSSTGQLQEIPPITQPRDHSDRPARATLSPNNPFARSNPIYQRTRTALQSTTEFSSLASVPEKPTTTELSLRTTTGPNLSWKVRARSLQPTTAHTPFSMNESEVRSNPWAQPQDPSFYPSPQSNQGLPNSFQSDQGNSFPFQSNQALFSSSYFDQLPFDNSSFNPTIYMTPRSYSVRPQPSWTGRNPELFETFQAINQDTIQEENEEMDQNLLKDWGIF